MLGEAQVQRYSRQLILDQIGGKGQMQLLQSSVLVIGAGGLGSPAALYLAAAGVGTIGIVDSDNVELSNLQRQIIHQTTDIGTAKVDSAKARINALNPETRVLTHRLFLDSQNIQELIRGYDFVIDGTDNFQTKFLINDACCLESKPFCHAGILRFEGQLMTVLAGRSACYRCVFHQPPPPGLVPSCSQAGILGVVAGVIGTLQATEAIKYLVGIGQLLTDTILIYDALTASFRKVAVHRRPDCPVCGLDPTITTLKDIPGPVCQAKNHA